MSARERANRARAQRYGGPDRRGLDLTHGLCPDCGKRRYASRADAKRAAQQSHGGGMRVYRCGEWWHMTSQDAETVARFREQPFSPAADRAWREMVALGQEIEIESEKAVAVRP